MLCLWLGLLKIAERAGVTDLLAQINALCDEVEKELDQLGEQPIHREGYRGGTWVLLDYGCVAIHVFNEEARAFYGLERLWSDGHALDLTGVLTPDAAK